MGLSVSTIAEKCKVSRNTVYRWFEKEDLPLEYVLILGKVLNYDFRPEFPEFGTVQEPVAKYGTNFKDKYFNLMEEFHLLQVKYNELMDQKLKEFALELLESKWSYT